MQHFYQAKWTHRRLFTGVVMGIEYIVNLVQITCKHNFYVIISVDQRCC